MSKRSQAWCDACQLANCFWLAFPNLAALWATTNLISRASVLEIHCSEAQQTQHWAVKHYCHIVWQALSLMSPLNWDQDYRRASHGIPSSWCHSKHCWLPTGQLGSHSHIDTDCWTIYQSCSSTAYCLPTDRDSHHWHALNWYRDSLINPLLRWCGSSILMRVHVRQYLNLH